MSTHTHLIPCLRYDDAPGAIDFLCGAFGFARHLVVADPADSGVIHHAQLTLGDAMIMLGSARPHAAGEVYQWRSPAEAGGVTMAICVVVEDPDAHAARARAAGAEILSEPHDNRGFPGRAYDVRDPGGHIWNFGSYDPFSAAVD